MNLLKFTSGDKLIEKLFLEQLHSSKRAWDPNARIVMSRKDEESSSLPFFFSLPFHSAEFPLSPFFLFSLNNTFPCMCQQWGGWLAGYHHQLVERFRSPLAKDQWTILVVGEMKEQEELPSSSRRQFPTYCVTTGRSRTGSQCARHGLRDGGKQQQQVDKDRTVPCYSEQPWDPSSFSVVTSINTNKLLSKSQFQYVYIYLSQM